MRAVGKRLNEELRRLVKEKIGISLYISKVNAVGGRPVVVLESMRNKIDLMKSKYKLGESKVWVDDDYTEREKDVQRWIEEISKEEKANWLDTKVGYMKLRVDGIYMVRIG